MADIHKPRPFLCVLHVLNGGPNPLRCALKDNLSFPKGRRAFGPVDLGVSLKYSTFSVLRLQPAFPPPLRRHKLPGPADGNLLLDQVPLKNDEDRHKIYVALTRAKEDLYIH